MMLNVCMFFLIVIVHYICSTLVLWKSWNLQWNLNLIISWQSIVGLYLTTLRLKSNQSKIPSRPKFPESWLMCLPALITLGLDKCELPECFSLPCLTTLCLESCILPKKVWDFPALSTLQHGDMYFPENMSDYFLALSSLRNLAIEFIGRPELCYI